MGQTQAGNNNAYCQDNEISWLDWSLASKNPALIDFVARLADLRRSRLWLRRDTFLKGARRSAAARDVTWLHPSGREMSDADWSDAGLRCLAVQMAGATYSRTGTEGDLLIVFNADDSPVEIPLPQASRGERWLVLVDTAVAETDAGPRILPCQELLRVEARGTVLLESDVSGAQPGA
jgi:glycogen operon protein